MNLFFGLFLIPYFPMVFIVFWYIPTLPVCFSKVDHLLVYLQLSSFRWGRLSSRSFARRGRLLRWWLVDLFSWGKGNLWSVELRCIRPWQACCSPWGWSRSSCDRTSRRCRLLSRLPLSRSLPCRLLGRCFRVSSCILKWYRLRRY